MGVTVTALQALLPDELCLSSLGLVQRRAQPTWVDGCAQQGRFTGNVFGPD